MRAASALLLTAFALPVDAGEVVVLGRVTEIVLLPEGHARCVPRCPTAADRSESICVSNSCGCGEAKIEVETVIVGASDVRSHTAPYRLGEWCMADFPLTADPILVRTQAGESQWSPLHRTPDGEIWFEAEAFETIAGVTISELPAIEGRISVKALRLAADL